MNIEFARHWAQAMSNDADTLASLYADACVVELGTYADAVGEALLTPAQVKAELARFVNKDPDNGLGIHLFQARNFEGHARHGIIQWTWTAEHLATFRGLAAQGRKLTTGGQTFQQYDPEGKITREATYWADLRVLYDLELS